MEDALRARGPSIRCTTFDLNASVYSFTNQSFSAPCYVVWDPRSGRSIHRTTILTQGGPAVPVAPPFPADGPAPAPAVPPEPATHCPFCIVVPAPHCETQTPLFSTVPVPHGALPPLELEPQADDRTAKKTRAIERYVRMESGLFLRAVEGNRCLRRSAPLRWRVTENGIVRPSRPLRKQDDVRQIEPALPTHANRSGRYPIATLKAMRCDPAS